MNKVTTCCKATYKYISNSDFCDKCGNRCTLEDNMVSTCKEHDKTLHVHTEGWEERLKKTFEISYNYDDVNVDKMNPEQRLLWSLFGRREKDKNPTDAIIDFIKSELKQRDKEWGEAIQELNKNLFKNNGK